MYVVRKIKGGLDSEKEYADSVGIIPGTQVEVIGGVVYSSISYYELKGYEGQFNTVMFSGEWEDHDDVMELQFPGAAKYQIQKIIDNLDNYKNLVHYDEIVHALADPQENPQELLEQLRQWGVE